MPFISLKNSVECFYHVCGSGNRTVVLIHGAGATCRLWALQKKALVEAGYRLIIYDVRGHGATRGTDGLYSIDLFSEDLYELLRSLEVSEEVILCGISMGGLIAQQFCIDHPDMVKAMILSNTYSFLGEEYVAAAVGVTKEEIEKNGISAKLIYDTFMSLYRGKLDVTAQMLQAADLLLPEEPGRSIFFDDQIFIPSEEDYFKTKAATGSFDSRSRLGEIKCPVLVIGSENDMIIPFPYSQYLHDHIEGSNLVMMKGMNHVPCLEDPENYNKTIIGFLDGIA